MKRNIALIFLCSLAMASFAQTNLEEHFNLCLEFGAPQEVVELFQSFRTYKGEVNDTISYVVREDNSLLKDTPYSEYQIWYTIDNELGLYQSSLILRADRPVLQNILTGYLRKFNGMYGEPVYTHLDNGSLLVFWYSEETFTVKARLILDIINSYKFVSVTYCSPLPRHTNLLRTLYYGTPEEEASASAAAEAKAEMQPPSDVDTEMSVVVSDDSIINEDNEDDDNIEDGEEESWADDVDENYEDDESINAGEESDPNE